MPDISSPSPASQVDGGKPPQSGSPWPQTLTDRFFAEVRERPLRSLLIAVGTGYLTAGGLNARLTGRVLGVTTQTALRLAVVPLLVNVIERAISNRSFRSFLPPPNRNNVHKEMHS